MIGEVQAWNSDMDPNHVGRIIQNCYRRTIDSRLWYGLLQKGQIFIPSVYSVGTVAVTTGQNSVIGTGTTWTSSMVGLQFRIGFTFPTYTITAVPSPTSLKLDLNWGGATYATASYQIYQSIVNLGTNVKKILAVINQTQGYRLILEMPQEVLNVSDAWRATTGWTYMLASYTPTSGNVPGVPAGIPQWELYPAPVSAQAFPFLAYTQPPDLKNDSDTPVLAIRSDVIVLGSIPDVLTWGGPKKNAYYDPRTAAMKKGEYNEECMKMKLMDNNLDQKDLIWEFDKYPLSPVFNSGQWAQSHDASFWP
jgi:hypothetical protein